MKVKENKKVSIADPSMGPFGYTIASIKSALAGLGALFKNPKILMLTVFISVQIGRASCRERV